MGSGFPPPPSWVWRENLFRTAYFPTPRHAIPNFFFEELIVSKRVREYLPWFVPYISGRHHQRKHWRRNRRRRKRFAWTGWKERKRTSLQRLWFWFPLWNSLRAIRVSRSFFLARISTCSCKASASALCVQGCPKPKSDNVIRLADSVGCSGRHRVSGLVFP